LFKGLNFQEPTVAVSQLQHLYYRLSCRCKILQKFPLSWPLRVLLWLLHDGAELGWCSVQTIRFENLLFWVKPNPLSSKSNSSMSKSEGSTGKVNTCVLLKWLGCEANFEEGWATLTLCLFSCIVILKLDQDL